MEKELKVKAKKDSIYNRTFGFVVFSFLAVVVVYSILTITNTFNIKIIVYSIVIIAIISMLYIIRDLVFINKSKLTYGTIVKVETSDPDNSQAYQNYFIEYIDESNNHTNQTIVYEQFGDNDDEVQEEIKIFFEQGQNKIGKKVPLLYLENNPNKTIVFMKNIEGVN